jgi:hypothetical protein
MSCRIYPSRPYTEIPRFRTVHIGSDIAEGCGDLIIIDCRTTIRTFDGCPAFCWAHRMVILCFFFWRECPYGGIEKPCPNSRALTENTGPIFYGPRPSSRLELTRYPPRVATLREILPEAQVAFARCRAESVLLPPLKDRWGNSAN